MSDCTLDYAMSYNTSNPAEGAQLFEFLNAAQRGARWDTLEGDIGMVDDESIILVLEDGTVSALFRVTK